MITTKAKWLSREARKHLSASKIGSPRYIKGLSLSQRYFAELFENCEPTEDEFARYTAYIVIDARSLWRLIVAIPKWQDAA